MHYYAKFVHFVTFIIFFRKATTYYSLKLKLNWNCNLISHLIVVWVLETYWSSLIPVSTSLITRKITNSHIRVSRATRLLYLVIQAVHYTTEIVTMQSWHTYTKKPALDSLCIHSVDFSGTSTAVTSQMKKLRHRCQLHFPGEYSL